MKDPRSPNAPSELVNVQTFENVNDLQLIDGYSKNNFRISGKKYSGPVILCPRQTLCWQPPVRADNLVLDHITTYLSGTIPPLFILGVGAAPTAPLDEFAVSLRNVGVALELMSTAAACRTWNILVSEGRAAATGLYAVE